MAEPIFTGANHICIVTADVERAIRKWSDRYGVGPWQVFAYGAANMAATVDGEPVDFRMLAAISSLGPHFRVEIIQPLDELSPYAKSLAEHDGADHLHHVRLDVANYDEATERIGGLGVPATLNATFQGGSEDAPRLAATYFATDDDLGFTLEISHRPEGFTMPVPQAVYPPPA
jgi:methylmalonyl-CoA/ethylmalonyl-CoA epimerase